MIMDEKNDIRLSQLYGTDLENFYSFKDLNPPQRKWLQLDSKIALAILFSFSSNAVFSSNNMEYKTIERENNGLEQFYNIDFSAGEQFAEFDSDEYCLQKPRRVESKFILLPIRSNQSDYDRCFSLLKKSYSDNVKLLSRGLEVSNFEAFFRPLATLGFKDDIVQYDSIENSLDVTLWLEHNLCVLVNIDIDSLESNNVLFSIYHDKKLLVCDEMPIQELVDKITQSIDKTDSKIS